MSTDKELAPIYGGPGYHPKTRQMGLFPVKEVEVDGIQMGVFSDGISTGGFSPKWRHRAESPWMARQAIHGTSWYESSSCGFGRYGGHASGLAGDAVDR
jgi:hypothetical protein